MNGLADYRAFANVNLIQINNFMTVHITRFISHGSLNMCFVFPIALCPNFLFSFRCYVVWVFWGFCVCLRPVSCVYNVAIVSGLSILDCIDCPSVFSNLYLSSVSSLHCCHCLWIVHSWLTFRCSLTFIYPVSWVYIVVIVSGLSILD